MSNIIPQNVKVKGRTLPESPGVYLMRGAEKNVLYVGKAANLRRRVESYFARPHDSRIQSLVREIRRIDYEKTDTAIEALIREAELIKKLEPPYNVKDKDGKSFLFVAIAAEEFPRVLLVRGKDVAADEKREAGSPRFAGEAGERLYAASYGPFTSASSVREAMRILRRIFPWNEHPGGSRDRPCLDYQIGLCPGTCAGTMTSTDYRRNMKNLMLFFGGGKSRVIRNLTREMDAAAKKLDFERAEKLKRKIFALQHIQDVALITDVEIGNWKLKIENSYRIEGYDISNISGTSAVGSMVVFTDGKPDKNEYRKFKIKTVRGSNDVAMLREVLSRRLRHREWPLPDLMLVDGGAPQVNAVRRLIRNPQPATRNLEFAIPVIGLAKGPERKRNDVVGAMPPETDLRTLIRVRDEAHRFAIAYHKNVRARRFLPRRPAG